MKPKTRIVLFTGLLFVAVGIWLFPSHSKTGDRSPSGLPGIGRDVRIRPKAGMDERQRKASRTVPFSKRLEERSWTTEELEQYLFAHGRSRESLIAAFLASNDPELIREAANRFPNDPMVLALALGCDASPDQRKKWAGNLKRMQPENAFAAYIMAWADFEDGDSAAALGELWRGVSLKSFDTFLQEGALALQGLNLELGGDPEEAKFRGAMELPLHYVQRIQSVTKQLESMCLGAESGDRATELAVLGAAIGNQFSEGPGKQLLLQQLQGLRLEEQFLKLLDSDMDSPYLSDSPRSLIQQIEEERQRIAAECGAVNYDELHAAGLLSHYIDRVMAEGEASANAWANKRLESK